jgi:hypothetical protein
MALTLTVIRAIPNAIAPARKKTNPYRPRQAINIAKTVKYLKSIPGLKK